MKKLRVLDLFSGIGGFSLGLERTGGFETTAFCEIDPFCQKVLAKHWPDVPLYDDITELTNERLKADGNVADIITGGFPCQAFSTAAHGANNAVDFWPEMLRVIGEVEPKYVIAENVIERPIRVSQQNLQGLGYATTVIRIGAHEGGAPHRRNRWWVCAYPHMHGQFHGILHDETSLLSKLCQGVWGWKNYAESLRVSDGVSDRVDRNICLGNSILPQIPEIIGNAILKAIDDTRETP